jgi:hypothetical protein
MSDTKGFGRRMADKLVNGEIIKAMEKKLDTALSQKRLSVKDRLQYEILQLIVMYLAEDHPKTKEMYSVFRPMQWAFLIMGGAMLGAIATGRVVIEFVK